MYAVAYLTLVIDISVGTGQKIRVRAHRNDTGPTLSDLYLSLVLYSLYMHAQCHPWALKTL